MNVPAANQRARSGGDASGPVHAGGTGPPTDTRCRRWSRNAGLLKQAAYTRAGGGNILDRPFAFRDDSGIRHIERDTERPRGPVPRRQPSPRYLPSRYAYGWPGSEPRSGARSSRAYASDSTHGRAHSGTCLLLQTRIVLIGTPVSSLTSRSVRPAAFRVKTARTSASERMRGMHRNIRSWPDRPDKAGQPGLEPGTSGFGDRRYHHAELLPLSMVIVSDVSDGTEARLRS